MVILGLLAALVVPSYLGRERKARAQAAKTQIELLGTALDTFRLDVGRYPTVAGGPAGAAQRARRRYAALGRPVSQEGRPDGSVGPAVRVREPRASTATTISTRYGADGAPGGDGDARDVASWAG